MARHIALAGNPNSGKTSLFNELTGSNQYVGNWPGVTVERKGGRLREHEEVDIIDLPGIYSLSPYTPEELVARRYLLDERPDLIVNVVDTTNLERNLYLTTQLMETGIPMVLALNMMDLVQQRGDSINTAALGRALGCPVVEVSALQQRGIDTLVELIAAPLPAAPTPLRFPPAVEDALAALTARFGCRRWDAVRLLSLDPLAIEGRDDEALNEIHRLRLQVEHAMGDDIASVIAAGRYDAIESAVLPQVLQRAERRESFSDKLDRVLTHRVAGLAIFAAVMWGIYYLSIQTIGQWGTDWANDVLFGSSVADWLGGFMGDTPASAESLIPLATVLFLCLFFPVSLRRLHDLGLSGAWYYLAIAPLALEQIFPPAPGWLNEALPGLAWVGAGLLSAFCLFWPGQPGRNAYGREPKTLHFHFFKLRGRASRTETIVTMLGVLALIVGVVQLGQLTLDCSPQLQDLVGNGIVAGVGAVLGFLPQMAVLFLLLSILEDCGYMARVAFMMDRLFRSIGLSGKSVIPLLVGMGCGVPAVMATRTIENDKDRRMSIMLTTFVPCGAKLPIIALIGALVGSVGGEGMGASIATVAYFAGFGSVILGGLMLRKSHIFAGSYTPFVMELPAYHMPRGGSINLRAMQRCKSFARKAGTVIFLSSALIWAMSHYTWRLDYLDTAADSRAIEQSMLADIGHQAAPLFSPLGWEDWRPAVATVTGLMAKENIVGTCGVLYASEGEGDSPAAPADGEEAEQGVAAQLAASGTFTVGSALSFMLFNLLCAPCLAACAAIRREMASARWTLLALGFMCGWAYLVSMMVYQFFTWYETGAFTTGPLVSCLLAAGIAALLFRKSPTCKH